MIQAPLQGLNPEARVCDIINVETNWWNIPLIEQVFPTETMEHVCNIAISPRVMKDRLIWAGTKTGQFTVRSAVHTTWSWNADLVVRVAARLHLQTPPFGD